MSLRSEQEHKEPELPDYDFNDVSDANWIKEDELSSNSAFQEAVKNSRTQCPRTVRSTLSRESQCTTSLTVSSLRKQGEDVRPITGIKGAGFKSSGIGTQSRFGMNSTAIGSPASPLFQKEVSNTESDLLEKSINSDMNESCIASSKGDFSLALTKAKNAVRKQQRLKKLRESAEMSACPPACSNQSSDIDMHFSVLFNLGIQYLSNGMLDEAYKLYELIMKEKKFSRIGQTILTARLRVNMGNIQFEKRDYEKAIKQYKMALDLVPSDFMKMRSSILRNVAICLFKMKQYEDALALFKQVMLTEPSIRTCFNIVLCHYKLAMEKEMKDAFVQLLSVDVRVNDENYQPNEDKQHDLILEVIRNDSLRQIEKSRKEEAEACVMLAARIISSKIERSILDGHDWCIEQIKASKYYPGLADNLEIIKVIGLVKEKEYQPAVKSIKSFGKSNCQSVGCAAATNLSFLYKLVDEGTTEIAEKFADAALEKDKFNPASLVNKGNLFYNKREFKVARSFYSEAYQLDSTCLEALHNFGLVCKQREEYDTALGCFQKLLRRRPNNTEAMFQIANINDRLGEVDKALDMYIQLIGTIPGDAGVLYRIGKLYEGKGDKSQAYNYIVDAFRYDSNNIQVIEWLGIFFYESQFAERALQFFEKAALIQPNDERWMLLIANSQRRKGNYQLAFQTLEKMHRKYPENLDCLKQLVAMGGKLNLDSTNDYVRKLRIFEKQDIYVLDGNPDGQSTSFDRRNSNSRMEMNEDLYNGGSYCEDSIRSPRDQRPVTSMRDRSGIFGDEVLGDDLLPN